MITTVYITINFPTWISQPRHHHNTATITVPPFLLQQVVDNPPPSLPSPTHHPPSPITSTFFSFYITVTQPHRSHSRRPHNRWHSSTASFPSILLYYYNYCRYCVCYSVLFDKTPNYKELSRYAFRNTGHRSQPRQKMPASSSLRIQSNIYES